MLQLNNKNGLSIIEVLVATGIMAILMAGFSSMMLNQNKETRAVAEILSAQDLMKSMIASLAKGDVCHHILSTRSFKANLVVAGQPQTIEIGNQPIYSSMVASGTPGPVLIKKGDKASAYTSSLEIESIQFEVTTGAYVGSIGNFQGRWIVNFDGSKSVRKLRPLSISAVITANTTVPAMANTISCLGSGGSMGSGDQNFLTKWVTDTEIKESVIYEDPVTKNIGVGTATPNATLSVSGAVKFGQTNAVCSPISEGQQKYNSTTKIMEFCNGTAWGPMGGSTESFMSRSGSGKKCPGDSWVIMCGYNPAQAWNYNVCYSRSHAEYYQWSILWNSTVGGYQLKCNNPATCGAWVYPYNQDLLCSMPSI